MLRRNVQGSRLLQRFNHHITFKPNKQRADAFKSLERHTEEHAKSTTALWRNISIGCVPVILLCAWYVYPKEKHHIDHLIELNKLPDEEWPVEMPYQNLRSRRFFWGDGQQSLFWGPTNHRKE